MICTVDLGAGTVVVVVVVDPMAVIPPIHSIKASRMLLITEAGKLLGYPA
jgi:hypothetical protein